MHKFMQIILIGIIVSLLSVSLVSAGHVQPRVDLIVNGAMLDSDANGMPDGWTGYNLQPGEQVVDLGGVSWFQFGPTFHQWRCITQHITLPAASPPGVTLTLHAAGFVTTTAAASVYVYYDGSATPSTSQLVHMPVNQPFDRLLKLVYPFTRAGATAVDVNICTYDDGYRVTDVQLIDMALPVGPLPRLSAPRTAPGVPSS